MVQTKTITEASSLPRNCYVITNDRLLRLDCGICVSTLELPHVTHEEQVKTAIETYSIPKNAVIYVDSMNIFFNQENEE